MTENDCLLPEPLCKLSYLRIIEQAFRTLKMVSS